MPAGIVPDCLKSAVTKADSYEPDLNHAYAAFARHYGMVVLSARSRKPKIKPFRTVPDSEGPAGGSVADLQVKKRKPAGVHRRVRAAGVASEPRFPAPVLPDENLWPWAGRRWSGAVCTSSSTGDTSCLGPDRLGGSFDIRILCA